MILEYSLHLKKGKQFNIVFFLDQHFDDEILENFKNVFTRLSYDEELDAKVTNSAKRFFEDSAGNHYEFGFNKSLYIRSSGKWKNISN
jgi:hypothetical protein